MKIELLNVRIYVSKNTVVADAIGNRKNEWQPYYTCYATVSAEGGKEKRFFKLGKSFTTHKHKLFFILNVFMLQTKTAER